jgi:hypothetical protein
MRAREAKDFLVQQTAEQAALENVPLSDLEKRMMYFTESGDCPEDPLALNEEFESHYNQSEYEAKLIALLKNAYQRTKTENSLALEQWHAAIKVLNEGDHYLTVLLGNLTLRRVPVSTWLRLAARLAILLLAVYGAWIGLKYFMKATGTSPGSIFGVAFVIALLSAAIRPRVMSELARRSILWLVVFLFKRKSSGQQSA